MNEIPMSNRRNKSNNSKDRTNGRGKATPLVPKAGVTIKRRRLEYGGKLGD